MNILVTGGAGFIGSHVVDAYVEAGHEVTVVDNLSTGRKEFVNPRAKFVHMDIRNRSMHDIFKSQQIDVVNHHAAQMDVRKSVDDPLFDASVNILGTLNLLENCRTYGVRKVVFASTGGAVYGEQEYFPADEQHPLHPLSPYGISKLAVEKYLFYYRQVHGLPHVILRYANVYGPRQNPHGEAGVIAIFAEKMLNKKQPVINGDGSQTRDYVFVKDVVCANLLALDVDKAEVFNIGTGVETTVNELFKSLQSLTASGCKEVHAPAKRGEQQRSVLACRKASQGLRWQPQVTLRPGLRQTVEFIKIQR